MIDSCRDTLDSLISEFEREGLVLKSIKLSDAEVWKLQMDLTGEALTWQQLKASNQMLIYQGISIKERK